MNQALQTLLDELDRIEAARPEVTDTDVRERMHDALSEGFAVPPRRHALPLRLGMYTAIGDRQVRAALTRFLRHPQVAAARAELSTPAQRLRALRQASQAPDVLPRYGVYFGCGEERNPAF